MIGWLEKKRFVSLLMTTLIMLEIFYFSSLSGAVGVETGNIWIPRSYHFIVFFLFSFFLFITIKGKKKIKPHHIPIIIIISILYAVLDEIHQIFVPGREANIGDVLTNSIGIFSSILLYSYLTKKINKLTIKKRK